MLSLFNSFITLISNQLVNPLIRHRKSTVIISIVIVLAGYQVLKLDNSAVDKPADNIPSVELISAASNQSVSTFSAIGTIQAISEAQLKAEAGGQVTGIYTEIGKSVRAGAILAQTENDRESAVLLQAQGSYEAALAGSAQSDIGVREAENGLADAVRVVSVTSNSAYGTTFDVLNNTIDLFYSNPNSSYPGVRLTTGDTTFLRTERVSLQTTLKKWYEQQNSNVPNATLFSNLAYARGEVERVLKINDILLVALNNEKNLQNIEASVIAGQKAGLTITRSQLIAAKNSLESASSNLKSAEEGLSRAKLAGSGNDVTLSGAQLKIALGSVRSAQAAYERTLVRTPISGVVNAFYLKKGDYVNPGTDAALVANNNGLQVETAINQNDRTLLSIGDNVIINDIASGTISAIAGAVDPTTGKIAVKISIADNSGLENGTVAKITLTSTKQVNSSVIPEIKIPLAAVKLLASGPVVFSVGTDLKLIALPVELGPVTVDSIAVISGITADQQIISDARGRKAGEVVTVSTN